MIRATQLHLEDAGESYFRHQQAALSIAASLAAASAAALVHAFVPGLFVRTASRRVARLNALLEARSSSRSLPIAGRDPAGSPARSTLDVTSS